MNIKKVEVEVRESDIVSLLSQGYTWLKKDDLGYGSIQEKYEATEKQTTALMNDPCFKDVPTIVKTFVFIKDRNKSTKSETVPMKPQPVVEETTVETDEAVDLFANL